MKFKTTLITAGKTATGIVIPPEIVESLNAGKKPPVKVTINGYTYRNTVAVMGGDYMVGVSALHREGAKVKGGDKIEVSLELDTEPRELEIPLDFQKVLNLDKDIQEKFSALSYSRKRGLVEPITGAKTEETRVRRIEKAISLIREGKA